MESNFTHLKNIKESGMDTDAKTPLRVYSSRDDALEIMMSDNLDVLGFHNIGALLVSMYCKIEKIKEYQGDGFTLLHSKEDLKNNGYFFVTLEKYV